MDSTYLTLRDRHADTSAAALREVFLRQRAEALLTYNLDTDVWDEELSGTVLVRNREVAREFGRLVADGFPGDFDPDAMEAWLEENARIVAEGINATTVDRLGRALTDGQPLLAVGDLFTNLSAVMAGLYARQMVTTAANFGAHDAAQASGAKTKTWQTNSRKPRPDHAALSGQTVPISDTFSNGMKWPGDPAGGGENNANCYCSVVFG